MAMATAASASSASPSRGKPPPADQAPASRWKTPARACRPKCASRFSTRSTRRERTAWGLAWQSSPRLWTAIAAGSNSTTLFRPARDFMYSSRARPHEAPERKTRNGEGSPGIEWTAHMKAEKPSILIVEDEPKMRRLLELQLAEEGFHARTSPDAETGLQLLGKEPFDVIVTDFKLPGMSGLEFLHAVKRVNAELPVVIMTAYGTVESAVDAMKAGASDYVLKPFSLAELVLIIRKELATHHLRQENRDLREALGHRYEYKNIVARSDKM